MASTLERPPVVPAPEPEREPVAPWRSPRILTRVCDVPPTPATASTLVPPAGGVTTTSYVALSR